MQEEEMDAKAARKKDRENPEGHIYELEHGGYVVNKDSEKDYVFISYSSKDWERVLHDIVYEACTKKGLRVYFDAMFDNENESWINQFRDNMKSHHCKAVLAFITPNYKASYATLMELMASQTKPTEKPVLPIVLKDIPDNSEANSSDGDTGLGSNKQEENLFDILFSKVVTKNHFLAPDQQDRANSLYKTDHNKRVQGDPALVQDDCCELVDIMLAGINNNIIDGINIDVVQAICAKLCNIGAGSVFVPPRDTTMQTISAPEEHKIAVSSPALEKEETDPITPAPVVAEPTEPKTAPVAAAPEVSEPAALTAVTETDSRTAAEPEKVTGTYLLADFLKKYNKTTFQSNSCKTIKLIGINGHEKYTLENNKAGEPFETARKLVFAFAMRQLDEMGMEYINLINEKNQSKNLIFITEEEHKKRKAEKNSVSYTKVVSEKVSGYSMCTHYSEYDWLKISLVKQIETLGMTTSDFQIVLDGMTGAETDSTEGNSAAMNQTQVERPAVKETKTEAVANDNAAGDDIAPISVYGSVGVSQIEGSYSLTEFLNKYDKKTFQSKSCKTIGLIGTNGCEKYTLEYDKDGKKFETARKLVYAFAMRQLDEMGMAYIDLINGKNAMMNPIFIVEENHEKRKSEKSNVRYTKVASEKVSGYSMCTHYSEYDWLKISLVKQLSALGLSTDNFKVVLEN